MCIILLFVLVIFLKRVKWLKFLLESILILKSIFIFLIKGCFKNNFIGYLLIIILLLVRAILFRKRWDRRHLSFILFNWKAIKIFLILFFHLRNFWHLAAIKIFILILRIIFHLCLIRILLMRLSTYIFKRRVLKFAYWILLHGIVIMQARKTIKISAFLIGSNKNIVFAIAVCPTII